jgi:hypothetical protein
MLRGDGVNPDDDERHGVCVHKADTQHLLRSCFPLSVSYGPCVGADTLHDIFWYPCPADCAAAMGTAGLKHEAWSSNDGTNHCMCTDLEQPYSNV